MSEEKSPYLAVEFTKDWFHMHIDLKDLVYLIVVTKVTQGG